MEPRLYRAIFKAVRFGAIIHMSEKDHRALIWFG